jgi:MFS family permease
MMLFSLINVFQGFGLGVTGPVIPVFVVSTFSVDFAFVGMMYSIGFGVASIVVQLPGGRCSDRFDRRLVMFVSFLASSPFFLLFACARSPVELILFMFVSNALLNFSWSAFQTLMMDATPTSKWGFINGISAATFWAGQIAGNAVSGILWDNVGTLVPFYASSLAIGLSAIFPLLLRETRAKGLHVSTR